MAHFGTKFGVTATIIVVFASAVTMCFEKCLSSTKNLVAKIQKASEYAQVQKQKNTVESEGKPKEKQQNVEAPIKNSGEDQGNVTELNGSAMKGADK